MTFIYNKNTYSIMVSVLLLLIFDIGNIHSLPSESKSEDSNKLQSLKDLRAPLVDQLWDLQAQLNDLIEEYGDEFKGNEEKVLTLVREVKVLLERIDELSKDILQLIGATGNSEEREKEKEKQKEIKDDVSATLFNANARKCVYSDEAFYEPLMKCFKIGESADGPCNDNTMTMVFHEMEGTNEGICDCKFQVGLVYHNQSGRCYQLNTQGPCKTGEWLIYDSKTEISNEAICQAVPDDECILDGSQVYHKGKCFQLGSRGPCADDQVLDRNSENWSIIECSIDPSLVGHSFADKVKHIPCPPGSRRAQNKQCRIIFRPGSGKGN